MAKKRKPMVMYFYSPDWDRNAIEKRDKVYNSCRDLGFSFNAIDVESENGVLASINYGVRNVPTAIIISNNKVIGVEKGNYIQDFLLNYC